MLKLRILIGFLSLSSVLAHMNNMITIPGLKVSQSFKTRLLEIETFNDFLWANLYIGIFYYFIYLGIGTALESTNPIPKTEFRSKQTKEQMIMGLQSLFWVILGSTIWMCKIDRYGPYYGYYESHDFGVKEWVLSLVIYAVFFDLWFYVTHVILHLPQCWRAVHKGHHDFIEPSAFAQDAVHPIEAIIQGPLGHFLPTLFFPMHPIWVNLFGFLTGIYALCAHDARWDPVGHINHHYYIDCNFGLWGFMDRIFNTHYNNTRFPIKYIPTYDRKIIKQE